MLASVSRLLGAAFRASPENPSTNLANPAQWLLDWVSGGSSAAGIPVTEDRAMGVPMAYACTRVIAEALASLPCHIYRRRPGVKFADVAPDHWAQPLISAAPNPLQTAFTWHELIAVHALLWGNHYSAIDIDNRGDVVFLPLLPWNVTVRVTSDGKRKVYIARLSDGSEKEFREDRILHIPALGSDGLIGISPVRRLRNMYGLAIAAENFGSKFFANDMRPSVILETPAKMNEAAQKNLVNSLYEKFSGAENKWKVLVLEEGAKMHTVQMPLEDAQFLQTRQLQSSEICAAFKVPPHMVAMTEKTTSWGTGIEQMDIGFAKHTILPWCRKIEQEYARKIFAGTDFFAKYSLEGLQRGDIKTRNEAYGIQIQWGVRTRNEVRELEDLPPLPDGDIAILPVNMTTFEKLQKPDLANKEQKDEPGVVVNAPVTVHNAAPEIKVEPRTEVRLAEKIEQAVHHTHEHPDIKELAGATRESSREMARAVSSIGDRLARSQDALARGVEKLAKESGKPRKAVKDKDGEILGSVPVDSL